MDRPSPEQWAAIVAGVQVAWAEAFARRDIQGLAALNAANATLYGSKAGLNRGRTGVTEYFASVAASFKHSVQRARPGRAGSRRGGGVGSGDVGNGT